MRIVKNYIRKIQYSFKKNKRITTPSLILMFVLLLSIAYSAFGTKLNIGSFIADVRLKKDVRITGVRVEGETPCTIERQVAGTYTVGDVVTCGGEQFYVIENQDTDTTEGIDMLTAKKINVDLTNPVQSDDAGEIEFALNEYWTNTENAYIYNSESNVHQYVEAYRDVLEGTGIDVLDAKLISTEQLLSLPLNSGCSMNGGFCSEPEWAFIPNYYWTGNGYYDGYSNTYNIYLVSDYAISTDNHWESDSEDVYWPKAGIRPVITIPIHEIDAYEGTSVYTDYNVNNISVGVNLPNEDSSVTFNVEITNLESAEVGILDITGLPENLEYELSDYKLGEKLCDTTGKCNLGITKNIGLTIKYKDGGYDSTKTLYDVVANFNFQQYYSITYSDMDLSSKCTIERQVDGKYSIGDLVTCGEENFYVIENQDTDTTEGINMLTAKKINVDLTNPVQSDSAGEIEFALNEYWTNTENAYIYNSESNVHQYVEAYRDVLEGTGMDVLDAKLISTEQLLSLPLDSDCSLNGGWCSEPEWAFIPNYYWTGNGYYDGNFNIYLVSDYAISTDNHWESDSGDVYWPKAGIRPVITIPTYEIEESVLPTEVLGGSTIVIDLKASGLDYLTIKFDGKEIRDYNYTDGILTLPNVSGNVEITNGMEEYNGTYIALNNRDVLNYTIYGNSTQDGTPTPTAPVDVVSIGEKTNNFLNPNAKLESMSAFLGVITSGIDKDYTLLIKLKEGKTSPNLSFGYIFFKYETSTAEAYWLIEPTGISSKWGDGETYALASFNPSENYASLIGVITNQSSWDKVMDACDVYLIEGIYNKQNIDTLPELEPYGYKIPVKISNDTEEVTHNIFLDEPLRKVGNYTDYIDFESSKIVRKVGAQIFDGSETWTKHTTTNEGYGVFRNEDLLTPLIGAPISSTFMTHFALTDITSTATWSVGWYRFTYSNNNINGSRLYVSSEKTTVNDFKTWLTSNKPAIYYPLATPIEETIELPEIITPDGATNISAAGAVIDLTVKSKSN